MLLQIQFEYAITLLQLEQYQKEEMVCLNGKKAWEIRGTCSLIDIHQSV